MILELSHELCKLIFDCQVGRNALDFHSIQLGGQHFFFIRIQMGIGLPGCFNLFMSQALRYHQDIKAHLDQQRGVGVPLRYNNDKRKKPLFSRGLSVCRHLFNSFSKLKHGEKNIEKRRLFH